MDDYLSGTLPTSIVNEIEKAAGTQVREIDGFPEYAVTADGRIFSVRYPPGKQLHLRSIRELKFKDTHKSLQIELRDDNRDGHWLTVAQVVAVAFLPDPKPDERYVIHKDGNYRNNHVSNLKWATTAEWGKNKAKNKADPRGVGHKKAVFTESDILEIKRRIADGEGDRAIAKAYDVSHSVIRSIRDGLTWREIGPIPVSPRPGRPFGELLSKKLTEDDVRKIRQLKTEGLTGEEIAKMYSISSENVYLICSRKTWKHVK